MLSDKLIKEFANQLGYRESTNRYNLTSPAFGRYQFTFSRGVEIARILKLRDFDEIEFINNPGLQDLFFYTHVKDIYNFIKENNLSKFEGREITGANKYKKRAKINIFGLIAGAHLAGKEGLKKFLLTNYDPHDSLGTYASDYIAMFSDLMKTALTENKKTLFAAGIITVLFIGLLIK